jgi:DNA-binding transcriptional regulator YiaG
MRINPAGYGQLTIDGKTYPAHRIAYELWNEPIPNGLVVRHKCKNRHCVNPEHLETGTSKENANDKIRDGTLMKGDLHYARIHPEKMARGERHGSVKLTANQVQDIRNRTAQSQREIAREFGVSQYTVMSIINRKTWKHIT